MITTHELDLKSNNTREWFATDGSHGGMTTLIPNRTRSVYYNRFEGALARCSIYDFSLNKIVSDESVINGGSYELIEYKGTFILDEVTTSKSSPAESLVHLSREIQSLKAEIDLLNPKSFPRFYVWKSDVVYSAYYQPLSFNEIVYNDGEMYNVDSGKVTIKENGMYIFCTNIYKSPKYGNVAAFISINGNHYASSVTLVKILYVHYSHYF